MKVTIINMTVDSCVLFSVAKEMSESAMCWSCSQSLANKFQWLLPMEKLSLCERVDTLRILEPVAFFRRYHILLRGRVNFDCVLMQKVHEFGKVSIVVTNGLAGNVSLKACNLARGFEGFDKSTIHEEIHQLYYVLTRICLFLCNSKLNFKWNLITIVKRL